MAQLKHVQTSVLDIAYERAGPVDAYPVVLLRKRRAAVRRR